MSFPLLFVLYWHLASTRFLSCFSAMRERLCDKFETSAQTLRQFLNNNINATSSEISEITLFLVAKSGKF